MVSNGPVRTGRWESVGRTSEESRPAPAMSVLEAEPVTERASKNKTESASLVGKPKSWRILVLGQSPRRVYPGGAWAAGRQEGGLECDSVCKDPYG